MISQGSKIFLVIFYLLVSQITYSQNDLWENNKLPTDIPSVFPIKTAEENDNKHSPLAFSKDGKEIYYSVYVNKKGPQKIFCIKFNNGEWSLPKVVSFSGKHKDGRPVFSKDGERIYFYSQRPISSEDSINTDYDIWFSERINGSWSKAKWGGENINSKDNDSVFEIGEDGTMYIHTYNSERIWKLYESKLINGSYQKRKLIKILSDPNEFKKPIKLDGKDFFILEDNVKKDKYYYSYLRISVKKDNGEWTQFVDLGKLVNEGEGRFPSFSRDGKIFFFVSYRTGKAEYYWLNAEVIYGKIRELKK